VPGEDAIGFVDQDRVGEAELDHGRRDLRHLVSTVRPRVALAPARLIKVLSGFVAFVLLH
jgi:hypothetical protein